MDATMTDPIQSATAAALAAQSTDAAPSKTLGKDDFMKLLVAQLENQDPMAPQDNTQFVSQLATFSSLEQLVTANNNLSQIAAGQGSLLDAQALGLIGKDALVQAGDSVRIRKGVPDGLEYSLPKPASQATLTVYDTSGAAVKTFHLDPSATGRVALDWDGTGDSGAKLPDGDYKIAVTATDAQGAPMTISLYESVPIDGVNFGGDGVALISGDKEIPFNMIVEIRAPNV